MPTFPQPRALPTATPRDHDEAHFTRQVIQIAHTLGWRHYHTHRSDHSAVGFPDLTMVRPPRILFAELKVAAGRTTAAQQAWLDELQACPAVEAYCWYPDDLAEIVDRLR